MTMNRTTNPEARSVALDLWKSLDFGLGTESGFSFNLDAYKAARDVTAHVIPAPETRMDDQGRPLDLLAPTVWHALCLLLFLFVRTRIKDSSFENPQELDTVFGTQGLFRGQARAWNITPLLWRSPEYRENERRLEELSAFWQYWASPEHDFSFDLFGKIDSTGSTAAIAQHYGLPTSLVDFTFDPRIAIWFACSESESEPIADLPAGLRDCAVVYLTSFYKLISVSKLQSGCPILPPDGFTGKVAVLWIMAPGPNPYPPFWTFSSHGCGSRKTAFASFSRGIIPGTHRYKRFRTTGFMRPIHFFKNP